MIIDSVIDTAFEFVLWISMFIFVFGAAVIAVRIGDKRKRNRWDRYLWD